MLAGLNCDKTNRKCVKACEDTASFLLLEGKQILHIKISLDISRSKLNSLLSWERYDLTVIKCSNLSTFINLSYVFGKVMEQI